MGEGHGSMLSHPLATPFVTPAFHIYIELINKYLCGKFKGRTANSTKC